MKVVLSRTALLQLDKALGYIDEHSPWGAPHVNAAISAAIELLGQYPYSGHTTNRPGFRRMVVSSYPYVIVYAVADNSVTIHRIHHLARRPI